MQTKYNYARVKKVFLKYFSLDDLFLFFFTILRNTIRLDKKSGMSVLFGDAVRRSKIMLMISSLS